MIIHSGEWRGNRMDGVRVTGVIERSRPKRNNSVLSIRAFNNNPKAVPSTKSDQIGKLEISQ